MKKSIFTLTLALLFVGTVNAQSISIGSDYAQIGFSQNSAFAEATYNQNLIWKLNTRFSAGVGIIQSESDSYVRNDNTKRFSGYTKSTADVAFMPSAMIGVDIPVYGLKLGLYSGYRSEINNTVNHRFVPVSISIRI